jgi:Beta-xylosidase
MAAEGGTGSNHSEVIFRSDKPDGIFVPCHPNPILTQRHLPADRNDAVTCVGHADIIRDTQGQYWALFFGMFALSQTICTIPDGRLFCCLFLGTMDPLLFWILIFLCR